MRTRFALSLCSLVVLACASPGPGTAVPAARVTVYLRAEAVPCEFSVVERVSQLVTATSTREYTRERDRTLGTEGARLGADAILVPSDHREPDRDNFELQFRVVDGVAQPAEYPVVGDAIRYEAVSCDQVV